MLTEKGIGTLAPHLEKPCDKFPPGVQLARHREIVHLIFRFYAVDQHFLEPPAVVEAVINEPVNEIDRAHLAHQAGVETERINAVEDSLRALRQLLDLDG